MINLNRPTCDDESIVRQSRIVAFDATQRAEKRKAPAAPKTHPMCAAMGRAYWAAEDVRMANAPAVLQPNASHAMHEVVAEVRKLVDEACGIPTKPQPDADGWILFEGTKDSVCPVPEGVDFEMRDRKGTIRSTKGYPVHSIVPRGLLFWQFTGEPWPCDTVAYRIILPAKPAALPGWRRGPDVPESCSTLAETLYFTEIRRVAGVWR